MSKEQSPSSFNSAAVQPEVPGLSYWLPEAAKPEKAKPEPEKLSALRQMFDYYG